MGKGKVYPSEISSYIDSISKAEITRLTSGMAHSFHLYFTNSGWYNNDSNLLIGSDKGGCTNLYSLDLQTGTQTQLTDFLRTDRVDIQGTFIHPYGEEAYFIKNNTIVALSLSTYEEKTLYHCPKDYHFSNVSCSSDGESIFFLALLRTYRIEFLATCLVVILALLRSSKLVHTQRFVSYRLIRFR